MALSIIIKQFDIKLVPNQKIGMTTGATIHTTSGLYMHAKARTGAQSTQAKAPVGATA